MRLERGYLSSINPESGLPYPLDEVGESCLWALGAALVASGTPPDPAPIRKRDVSDDEVDDDVDLFCCSRRGGGGGSVGPFIGKWTPPLARR